jgi:tetratricopeptide (TPR) repeat protein
VLLERIGQGGMGEVYKARDDRMGRVVAVKVLSHGAIISDETVARFRREVRAAAQLSHPNIVTAYDADEAGGIHFLVMEYVDGTDLATMVKERGPLPVAQAVDYLLQAAAALQYAHDKGIIHRDVKPGNLLVDRKNTVKVLDMGLARFDPQAAAAASLTDGLTVAGQIMGSLDYLAPEQAVDPDTADRQADVYSLGCTLFYLLTGKPIYQGETVLKAVVAHREQSIPRLGQLRKDVPETVETVFRKMVAKQPGERPATMNDVIDALGACRPSTGRRVTGVLAVAAVAVAAILAAIMVGLGWPHWFDQHAKGNATGPHGNVVPTARDPIEDNAEAYALYQKGKRMVDQRQEGQMQLAIDDFQQAVHAVPTSVLAYTKLADAYNLCGDYGWLPADGAFPKAKAAAQAALTLDDRSPDAHLALAFTLIEYDCDWPRAEKEHLRALALAPHSADAHHWYAWYLVLQRRFDEAESQMTEAQRLAPADLIIACNAGKIQYYARNYRAGVEKYKEALKLNPDFRKTHWDLGLAYVQLGKLDAALREFDLAKSLTDDSRDLLAARALAYASAGDAVQARTILAKLERLTRHKSIAYEIAAVYAALSQSDKDSAARDKDAAFSWLERAFREHSAWRCYVKIDPRLDGLRTDPRFEAFLRRAGLAAG